MTDRIFSTRKMLRMTNNQLLEQFFRRLHLCLPGIDWRKLPGRCEEQVMAAIEELPAKAHHEMESNLIDVHHLACVSGVAAIIEAARRHDVTELLKSIPQTGPYQIAMWTWLHYKAVFERALLLERVARLTYSRRRVVHPRVEPKRTPDALASLSNAISNFLRCEEGRGHRCTIDHFQRDDGTDYYAAHVDDFVHTFVTHNDHGELEPFPLRKTFKIVFSYHQDDGVLEIFAKVQPNLKDRLLELFGIFILGEDFGLSANRKPYDLDRFKQRYFCLDTDPEDGVVAVISALRLASDEWGAIGLNPIQNGKVRNIYEMAESCINQDSVPWDDLTILNASIQFCFSATRNSRGGQVMCNVSRPDRCSMRCRRPDRVAMIKKYLKRWGILCAPRT